MIQHRCQSIGTSRRVKQGFTLIELLVVIAIIAILAAILFPVFARARENARRSSCLSNEKQIGLGILQYTQDYDEKYPCGTQGAILWPSAVEPYLKSGQIFDCPSSDVKYSGGAVLSYGYNVILFERDAPGGFHQPISLGFIQKPAQTLILTDARWLRIVPEDYGVANGYNTELNWTKYRHLDTTNVLFADGHVKSLRRDAVLAKAPSTDLTEDGNALDARDTAFLLWNEF